jgi:phosphoribosylamine---glycine ligase
MKILLIGSGGREHALAQKLAASPLCTQLFVAPGNPGTSECGTNVDLDITDFPAMESFVKKEGIEFIVPGPEAPLAAGIADYFMNRGIITLGPFQNGAMLESSKDFSKQFMLRHGIPTAAYRSFKNGEEDAARNYIRAHSLPIVIKASGLAAGKGVVICNEVEDAVQNAMEMLSGDAFGDAGSTIVIEEFLTGIELSVFALTDGEKYVLLPEAKDYKRIGEGDTGLNTGGMGAVSPVPFATPEFMKKITDRIVIPTLAGLQQEGHDYRGIIFFGIIKVAGEPFVIEYNVRMGDPETEVVMPRLEDDLVQLFWDAANGRLNHPSIAAMASPLTCVTLMLVSGGYPGKYESGKVIHGLDQVEGSQVFHAGTKRSGTDIVTAGGRVMAITSMGKNIQEALARSIVNAERIEYEGKNFRSDIGRDLIS